VNYEQQEALTSTCHRLTFERQAKELWLLNCKEKRLDNYKIKATLSSNFPKNIKGKLSKFPLRG